jgi:DNA-binding CsgD family transcriptional regulator
MQTYQRKQSGERRLPTPLWALNDSLLRELLIEFLERRFCIHKPEEASFSERRELIRQAALAQRPRIVATLEKLNREYVQAQRDSAPRDRLATLELEIEVADTYVRTMGNDGGLFVLASVVYLYYRLTLDSVGVAGETGLKPPHVRQLLWRLNHLWKNRSGDNAVSEQRTACPPVRVWTKEEVAEWAAAHPVPPDKATPIEEEDYVEYRVPRTKIKTTIKATKPAARPQYKWDFEQAVELRRAGLTYKEIGEKLGASISAIQWALTKRDMNIPIQRTNLDYERVAEMRRAGMTHRDIAIQLGYRTSAVGSALQTMGLGKKRTIWDVNEAIELRRAGLTCKKIAEKIGVSEPTIYVALKKAGVEKPIQSRTPSNSPRAQERARLRAAGICTSCKKKPSALYAECGDCRAYYAAWYRKSKRRTI